MKKKPKKPKKITEFNLKSGKIFDKNYEILDLLGKGWEGEVYRIQDLNTGIERAAKLFFPHRNIKNKTSNIYAAKLHRLRECPVVIHYHHQEIIRVSGQPVTVLVSEYVEGELLSNYLLKQPRKRLSPFQALHLLFALVLGIENIHHLGEYHGDLHTDNVIVLRHGLNYHLKLLDFFHYGRATKENKSDDIVSAIQIFHEALGGAKQYSKQPKYIKEICLGLKHSLIKKKFKTASDLRVHLENLSM